MIIQTDIFKPQPKITKTALKEFIQKKLSTDRRWAMRALIRVYNNQTEDEQAVGETRHHNAVGFSGSDAEFLSSLARQYKERGRLSTKQVVYLHKKITKYWKQVLDMSNIERLKETYLKEKLS